jgi:hypothetical protein
MNGLSYEKACLLTATASHVLPICFRAVKPATLKPTHCSRLHSCQKAIGAVASAVAGIGF